MLFGSRKALITGITGQDGSYLAELLLDHGYSVVGLVRRTSTPSISRIENSKEIELVEGDLTDPHSLDRIFSRHKLDEIYHLGAQTFVGTSWTQPKLTAEVTGIGTLNMLEATRKHALDAKFYQASSSEQFGKSSHPQNEDTPFYPRSPYGSAKVFAHHTAVNYRESYDMHVSCGILFNHESPRRGIEFITRKVTSAAAKISLGKQENLCMGSLHPKRDWGHAKDYVEAMWLMLQQDNPDDYVIATGVTHSVQELVELAFRVVNLNWKEYYVEDPNFVRPADVHYLLGNAAKAKAVLGWEPKITFKELIEDMVAYELDRLVYAEHV